jgi:hypothetical protein
MAKSSALSRFQPRPVIIQMPRRSGGRVRRAASRVAHVARRAGRRARQHVPAMGLAVGGLALGFLDGKGYLDKLPQIGGSKVFTLGLAGYAATRYSSNPMIRQMGMAALTVAAFDFGKVQAGGTSGFDSDGGGGRGSGQGY